MCLSSIADVLCKQGRYDEAVVAYKRVPDWKQHVEVRTGLADVLRRQGKYPEAEVQYDQILREWSGDRSHRAAAGKAEIAKQRGDLGEAIRAYEFLIAGSGAADDPDGLVYRMAKCNVLKQANRLQEAYQVADDVVSDAPFLMHARVTRACILGLLRKEEEGLGSINGLRAESTVAGLPSTLDGWYLHYYRGLLLLKADRYQDAVGELRSEFNSAVLTGDDLAVMRLGAAFVSLYRDDVTEAGPLLGDVGDIRDTFTRYVHRVLQLHVAVAEHDSELAERISRELEGPCIHDDTLRNAVMALSRTDFDTARGYELELLLRIAA